MYIHTCIPLMKLILSTPPSATTVFSLWMIHRHIHTYINMRLFCSLFPSGRIMVMYICIYVYMYHLFMYSLNIWDSFAVFSQVVGLWWCMYVYMFICTSIFSCTLWTCIIHPFIHSSIHPSIYLSIHHPTYIHIPLWMMLLHLHPSPSMDRPCIAFVY